MDPLSIGFMAGGSLAQIGGGLLSAFGQDEAIKRQQEQLRKSVAASEDILRGTTTEQREMALLEQKRAERVERQNLRAAQNAGYLAQLQVLNSAPYQAGAGFIMDQFSQGLPEFLAREYAGRLRTAQAARGLEFGGAPAQDEAALLTKMAYEHKVGLLDQLRQLSMDPMNINNQAAQAELATRSGAQQMGLMQMQSRMATLGQAQDIARSQADPLVELQMALAQMPQSSGAMGVAGTALSGFGGAMSGFGSMYQQSQDAAANRSLMSQLLAQKMGGPVATAYAPEPGPMYQPANAWTWMK